MTIPPSDDTRRGTSDKQCVHKVPKKLERYLIVLQLFFEIKRNNCKNHT